MATTLRQTHQIIPSKRDPIYLGSPQIPIMIHQEKVEYWGCRGSVIWTEKFSEEVRMLGHMSFPFYNRSHEILDHQHKKL